MKTFWTNETVQHGRSGVDAHAWLRAKAAEFESKTGVAWSVEACHGGQRFHPYMRAQDAVHADEDVAERLREMLEPLVFECGAGYRTLLGISEALTVPLPVVCGTAYVLSKPGYSRAPLLKVTVDRMGKPTAVAWRLQ